MSSQPSLGEHHRTPGGHEPPQAIVRIVPHGGARTAQQIRDQWKYLSRKGEVPLQRSERYFGIYLPNEQLDELAESWIEQTGSMPDDDEEDGEQEFTTHIVVSFPPGTDLDTAFAAGRAWADEMFGSGENGGSFDYLTACHSDRPHPHVHLVVNRRALEGHWLKISKRHAHMNYDNLRSMMVDVAARFGIELEATSRLDRGITEPPINFAQYRRQARGQPRDRPRDPDRNLIYPRPRRTGRKKKNPAQDNPKGKPE